MSYLLDILVQVNLYVAVAVALNLLAGYTGMLSLCTAAFFGTGAYAAALLTGAPGWPWPLAMAAGVALAAALALVIGAATLRFRDDYFAIATFAFQVIITSLAVNWVDLTQGPLGVAGIAAPELLGWRVDQRLEFLALSAAFAVVTVALALRLTRSPYGRLMRTIREDETLARALGKNVAATRVSVFALGATLAAAAGALYAPYVSYVDPYGFDVNESIFILAIVIIGGAGNVWGTVFGAAFLAALPEALRFLEAGAAWRQIVYGSLLAGCMIWRPQGFFGRYSFQGTRRG